MAGQSKSDDPNIVKKSRFSILLHVIVLLLYLTEFNKTIIGGQVIYNFFHLNRLIFKEIIFS